MGMGWKSRRGALMSELPCKCGNGTIKTYEVEEESDYPPFERTSTERVINCPKKCQSY